MLSRQVWGIAVLIILLANTALAAGIKFNYTRISVDNLPIGTTTSMVKIANLPLQVTNRFDQPMLIKIEIKKPQQLVDGYEVIPSSDWLKTEYTSITVAANAMVTSDVRITIPDDMMYLGKKYQVNLSATVMNRDSKGFLQIGFAAEGSFLFSVAPVRNEAALKEAETHPSDARYEVDPPRLSLWKVKPGKSIHVVSDREKPLELRNTSDKVMTYYLSSIDPTTTTIKMDEFSHFGGSVEHVLIKQDEITLAPGKSKPLGIEIRVPEDADFKKGKLAYFVEVAAGTRMGVKKYISVYLSNEAKPKVER